jgi:hypothetical protein
VTVKRGWTSQQLEVVSSDDASYWSTADAAILLAIPAIQIRNLIKLASIEPAGKRHGPSRRGGRYVRVYAAIDIIKAYEAVTDAVWLGDGESKNGVSELEGDTSGLGEGESDDEYDGEGDGDDDAGEE